MSWDAIAAVGELLGALGVIISLIYLGTQVRGSAAQTRHAAARSVLSQLNASLREVAAAPSLSGAYHKATNGLSNLDSDSEAMQLSAFYLSMVRPYEELFHYHRTGAVDDWAWSSAHSLLESMAKTPGFADWWQARAEWFTPDFRAHIDKMFAVGRPGAISDFPFRLPRTAGESVQEGGKAQLF